MIIYTKILINNAVPRYNSIRIGENMKRFKPDIYQKNIFGIDYGKLKQQGIKLIIFDLDNTLVPAKSILPKQEVVSFMKKLSKKFDIVLVSNNKFERVQKVSEIFECQFFSFAIKPSMRIKKYLKKKYLYTKEEMVIIGDQLLTDIYMGNRLGIKTILVDPLTTKDLRITSFNRFIEKRIMKKLRIIRGEYYGEE